MKKEKEVLVLRVIDDGGECRETVVRSRRSLSELIRAGKLVPTDRAARMFARTVPYIRRLCKAGKVDVERILGRYYFTPKQIAAFQSSIRKPNGSA